MPHNQTPEELATQIRETVEREYAAARAAVEAEIRPKLDRTDIVTVNRAVRAAHPELKDRFINAAMADLRGSLFYLESDGRITSPHI